MTTTTDEYVPLAELARHGTPITVINALRRTGMLFVDELRMALESYDRAIAAGLTPGKYLARELPGIGPVRMTGARKAYEAWKAAQPSTEDTDAGRGI